MPPLAPATLIDARLARASDGRLRLPETWAHFSVVMAGGKPRSVFWAPRKEAWATPIQPQLN